MKRFLLPTYEYPPVRGGVSEYLFGLVLALPDGTVEVLKLEHRPRFMGWLSDLFRVFEVAKKLKTEALVVSHVLPLGYIALLHKMLRKTPYAVIVHGTDLLMAGRSSWKRFWLRRILAGAALVVANSEFTRRIAVGHGVPEAKTEIVHPCPAAGSDPARGLTPVRRRGSGHHLLAVSRLVRRKGLDRLVTVMPRLVAAFPDAELTIAGDGPEEASLKAEARALGLGKRVRLVGAVPRAALDALYDQSDIFVLPGRPSEKGEIEGFGIVLMEAALHGLPVVAGRIGGTPEAVIHDETGLLTDPASDEELFAALKELLSDPARARSMGEAARERVLREFTWDKQAAKLIPQLEAI